MPATTFDFTPLFRTSVGFDRMSRLLDSAARIEEGALSYPPYNIEQVGEHKYSITMALEHFKVAGNRWGVFGCFRQDVVMDAVGSTI